MSPLFVAVTGLPRSGSTLVCQLLSQHPDIHCEGNSSALCNVLLNVRRTVSDDQFFLAQLDRSFESSYAHLSSAMRGFLHGWNRDCHKAAIVDKNRAWLHAVEFLLHIEPNAKLVVCLRELGQIYGSIEAQHQRTILVDFADHLADLDRFGRADTLFAKDKVVGAPLVSLYAVQDLSKAVQDRLLFLHFEDLIERPAACMSDLYTWLGLQPFDIDPAKLMPMGPQESDSHYRMKFPHTQSTHMRIPPKHEIPSRIQARIEDACSWYYRVHYPQWPRSTQ